MITLTCILKNNLLRRAVQKKNVHILGHWPKLPNPTHPIGNLGHGIIRTSELFLDPPPLTVIRTWKFNLSAIRISSMS